MQEEGPPHIMWVPKGTFQEPGWLAEHAAINSKPSHAGPLPCSAIANLVPAS
jgi:hypothetical protein